MIHQLDMRGKDKVETAMERLKCFEPPEGYYLAFSGGKDSFKGVQTNACKLQGTWIEANVGRRKRSLRMVDTWRRIG